MQRNILQVFFKKNLSCWKKCLLITKPWLCFNFSWLNYWRQMFRQLKFESPSFLNQLNQGHDSMFQTRWLKNNFFGPKFSWTLTKIKLLTKCLQKAYNWLKITDLIPFSFWIISACQSKQHFWKITSLYIVGNKQLLELFCNCSKTTLLNVIFFYDMTSLSFNWVSKGVDWESIFAPFTS